MTHTYRPLQPLRSDIKFSLCAKSEKKPRVRIWRPMYAQLPTLAVVAVPQRGKKSYVRSNKSSLFSDWAPFLLCLKVIIDWLLQLQRLIAQ